ncbi:MAG: hypothetical protein NTZ74_02100 [Chloroflexi bacterium]|nr:hypothetical protein [Chloroflexota bacterium]
MLLGDGIAIIFTLGIGAFFAFPATRQMYLAANTFSPELLSFLKFAILATGGEVLSWRLKKNSYDLKEFGLLPKTIFWGIFGVIIYWAFTIFANGTPKAFPFLETLAEPYQNILSAFLIAFFMNMIFSPVFMMVHHLCDNFINNNKGTFPIQKFNMMLALKEIDWNRMWNFVYKKTIPFFWVPAHTITFMLPTEYRMIFAASLSVVLGLVLGSVNRKG